MLSTDFVNGAPNWLDLGSPDTAASAEFYGAVFGWDLQSAGPDAGGYGFFQLDGRTVAGLSPLAEEGASPAWTVYFQTPDADATARGVKKGGGRVRVEPFDVMDAGRMSCLTDPGGAEFAVWQPGAVQGLERASETHSLCWAELHTADPEAALACYRSLFGWRSQEMEIGERTYRVLSAAEGDRQEASFGGLVPFQGDEEEPHWVPYFGVEDADAIVAVSQERGGSVLAPAADVPEVGRIAWIADPFGAPFAILKPDVVND
ncbi:VOC family protein [Streptomyces sp. NPDC047071]|uniref:VOC family protein n=1 Tax=Streptomyces sp. NPDC047071 TaxID=3154808 RepID=UPI0034549C7B